MSLKRLDGHIQPLVGIIALFAAAATTMDIGYAIWFGIFLGALYVYTQIPWEHRHWDLKESPSSAQKYAKLVKASHVILTVTLTVATMTIAFAGVFEKHGPNYVASNVHYRMIRESEEQSPNITIIEVPDTMDEPFFGLKKGESYAFVTHRGAYRKELLSHVLAAIFRTAASEAMNIAWLSGLFFIVVAFVLRITEPIASKAHDMRVLSS